MRPLTVITLICLVLTSCDLFRDKSLPPGVVSEAVANVPREPDFNAHIRPLLWRLSNAPDNENARRWQSWIAEGVTTEQLAQQIKLKQLHGVETVQDLTLLWRWARSESGINHPQWLYSPLPQSSLDISESSRKAGITKQLADYWLKEIALIEDLESPFAQWIRQEFESERPYNELLTELYTQSLAHPNSLDHLANTLLVGDADTLRQRYCNILGAPSGEILGSNLKSPSPFPDDGLSEPRLLYTDEAIQERRTLSQQLTELLKQSSSIDLNLDGLNKWTQSDAGYIPLTPPDLHLPFDQEGSSGCFGNGLAVHETIATLAANLSRVSSLSYWASHKISVILQHDQASIELSQNEETFTVSLQKNGQLVDSYQQLLPQSASTFHHYSLCHDPTSRNGFKLYRDGVDITPQREFLLDLQQPLGALKVSGDGVIDEVKIHTKSPLTELEQLSLYDPSLPLRLTQSAPNETLINHFDQTRPPPELLTQIQQTRSALSELDKHTITTEAIPSELPYELKIGEYSNGLVITKHDSAQIADWLTSEASAWLARATVNWVHEVLQGQPLIDMGFPQDTIPDNWEQIDQWASLLIHSGWNLNAVAEAIANRPEQGP